MAKLVVALSHVTTEMRLSHPKVAVAIGVDRPTVSKLRPGRTGGFARDRLMPNLLGPRAEISISPTRSKDAKVSVSVAHVVWASGRCPDVLLDSLPAGDALRRVR